MLACCSQGAICHWVIKRPATKAFSSFKVQCCGLGKKGQQLFSPMGGDGWGGHRGVFGKEKASWVFGARLLQNTLVLGQSLPGVAEWHRECGQVTVGDPAFVGSKLKPPGTFLCHQLPAPTASRPSVAGWGPLWVWVTLSYQGPAVGPSDLLATPLSFTLSFSRWQNSSRWPWPGFRQDCLSSHF